MLSIYYMESLITCARVTDCSTPSSIDNGNLIYTSTLFGDTANVTCDVGYSPSVDVITCTSAGRWDSSPRCSPVGKGCTVDLLLEMK